MGVDGSRCIEVSFNIHAQIVTRSVAFGRVCSPTEKFPILERQILTLQIQILAGGLNCAWSDHVRCPSSLTGWQPLRIFRSWGRKPRGRAAEIV